MKKIIILVLALGMILSLGAYVFADDDICELSDEEYAKVLSIKEAFLEEKVSDGTITQDEADEIYADLESQSRNRALRGLGFGAWLRDSEYADVLYEIMPRKGSSLGRRRGCRNNR